MRPRVFRPLGVALFGMAAVTAARADVPVLTPVPGEVVGEPVLMAEPPPGQGHGHHGHGHYGPLGHADHHHRRRPVLNWIANLPGNCWSHHNRPTCGSLGAELTFIFGSCRSFYGEPCLPGPPPPPTPAGYLKGYGAGGGWGHGPGGPAYGPVGRPGCAGCQGP